ncbi:MAG: VOC family protein [Eubacteriales bacterium]|nr:VOC family protein [Eubacteriales bacterium]MDD3349253.1 VOC family protein [Eubacteriales bacterium]
MTIRYVHTNIIARDWKSLSLFYQKVFGCKPVPPPRDICGEWIDKMTGIKKVHITGEHLALPGYEDPSPTLEIFSYNTMDLSNHKNINAVGLGHIAFEVDNIVETLRKVLTEGGSPLGEIVQAVYPDGRTASFMYVKDPEGNIIELQKWK